VRTPHLDNQRRVGPHHRPGRTFVDAAVRSWLSVLASGRTEAGDCAREGRRPGCGRSSRNAAFDDSHIDMRRGAVVVSTRRQAHGRSCACMCFVNCPACVVLAKGWTDSSFGSVQLEGTP
jgi:hypothetical protein